MNNICLECGCSYLKIQPHQKYCSQKCGNKAQHRRWQKKYPEKQKEYLKKYQIKLRADVFQLYGNQCVKCGETDPTVLSIDHKIPVGKNRTLTYPLYAKIRKHKNNEEYLSRFQLLCRNCNWIKYITNNERERSTNGNEISEPPIIVDMDAQKSILIYCEAEIIE